MDKTESDLLTERFELRLSKALLDGFERASQRLGLTPSAWNRMLILAGIRETLGEGWNQEHPQGDHGTKGLVKPAISGGDHEK